MKNLSWIQKSIYSALIFFGTIIVLSLIYAGVTNIFYSDLPTVNSGSGLTATSWNDLVNYANKAVKQDTEVLTVTGGNVGIGTVSPTQKLTVSADSVSGGYSDGQLHLDGADTNKRMVLGYDTTNNYGWIQPVRVGVGYDNLILNKIGGNVGIGTTSPWTILDVNGSITSRNSVTGATAERIVKVQGASGAFTHLRVTVSLHGAGGWLYRIQTASTWPVASQAGGGYTNWTANFSHTASEGAWFTVTSPSSNVIQFDYNGWGTHPVCIFEIVGSLWQNFTDADIIITYS